MILSDVYYGIAIDVQVGGVGFSADLKFPGQEDHITIVGVSPGEVIGKAKDSIDEHRAIIDQGRKPDEMKIASDTAVNAAMEYDDHYCPNDQGKLGKVVRRYVTETGQETVVVGIEARRGSRTVKAFYHVSFVSGELIVKCKGV